MADRVIEQMSPALPPGMKCVEAVTPLTEAVWALHRPAVHLLGVRDQQCVGRCSIWNENTPRLDGAPVGVIGHYTAADASAGRVLIDRACAALAAKGLGMAVGPMDGNTWRSYRLVTERGAEPPFVLEPQNPPDYPEHWTAAGFEPLAHYFSALNDDLTRRDPRVPEAIERLARDGIYFRTIDLARFETELAAVHELSVEAFVQNFLYTPIELAEFLAMYAPLRPHLRPEMVLLAERAGVLVGFMYGLPDLLEQQRGQPARTAVAKSLAVRPGRTGAGLGSVLMDQFHQAARACGFSRVIHALMHERNVSRTISSRYGPSIRRYTLFARRLP